MQKVQCIWNVSAPLGSKISVGRFSYAFMVNDRLQIQEGTRTKYLTSIGTYNGTTSASNNLLFVFVSHPYPFNTVIGVPIGFQITLFIIGMQVESGYKLRFSLTI